MLSPETSTLLTLCCYGAATVAGLAGMLLRNAFWRRLGCWLAGLGFVCQTFSLLLGFHKTMPTGLSLGGYLQMLAWFVLLFIAVVLAKGTVYWTMLLLPLPILAVVLLSLGVGLFMASIGVYIRDIQQCVAVIIRVLFFITPIFYPINAVPPGFRFIIRFNPLAYIIEETRKVFWYGMTPNWTIMLTTIAACALCAHLGLVWFIKTKKGFADVI